MANNPPPDNAPPQTPQPPPDDETGGGSMVFPGDQEAWDEQTTPEAKDHMLAAFKHAAGLGPHPGKKAHKIARGPRAAADDEITDIDRQRAYEEPIAEAREASADKMKAARTGGTSLGPSEFEQKQVQQQGALEQQATTQSAAQAAQARAQQTSVTPPAAPVGPQGTTVPYSAQKGAIGPQKGAAGAQMPPPSAPGPQEEGEGPEGPESP